MVEVDPDDPGVRRPDQVHRPGLRQGGGRATRRRERAGRSSPTATRGGGSSRHRSRSGSSRSGRSAGCWSAGAS
jgi:hypothetical protein